MSSYNQFREECVRLEQDIKTKEISLSSSKRFGKLVPDFMLNPQSITFLQGIGSSWNQTERHGRKLQANGYVRETASRRRVTFEARGRGAEHRRHHRRDYPPQVNPNSYWHKCSQSATNPIWLHRSLKAEQEAELDGHRLQLKRVMSQRETRVKLEMLQKELATKKQQERRLMVSKHLLLGLGLVQLLFIF